MKLVSLVSSIESKGLSLSDNYTELACAPFTDKDFWPFEFSSEWYIPAPGVPLKSLAELNVVAEQDIGSAVPVNGVKPYGKF